MSGTEHTFLSAVEATIRRYQMLEPGNTVLVGVSGGPDSVALLHCLVALRAKWSLRLVVAHLNHQLRGATADQEAAFVDRLASRLDIACEIGSRDVASYSAEHRLSVQEAAREVRYTFYDEVAAKCAAQKIALGHQANDNAESILMHLLRGTGPRGLAGIPPVREGRIIRPLIESTRPQVLSFLDHGGFECVWDHSNLDTKYLRNRIRHELLPGLEKNYNPNAVSALTRLATIVRDEEDFLNHQATDAFQDIVLEHTRDRIVLPVSALAGLHPALLRRVIRHSVLSLRGSLKRLGHSHVQAAVRIATGPHPSSQLDLPHGIRVVRDGNELILSLGPSDEVLSFEYDISGTGTTFVREIGSHLRLSALEADQVGQPKKCPPDTALFDLDAVSFPLKLRSFRQGDRFRPLGMSGSQKLKAFFINHKISRSKRRRCPLLLSGGRIIWVGGYRIDDSAKVTEETKRVLKAELLPA
jgi:tRNA(Ile)-lysidine synthase